MNNEIPKEQLEFYTFDDWFNSLDEKAASEFYEDMIADEEISRQKEL